MRLFDSIFGRGRKKDVESKLVEKTKIVGILPLGGMSAIGEKNCMAVFCGTDAIVIDCGEKVQSDVKSEDVNGDGGKKRKTEKPPDCYVDLEKLNGFNVLLLVLTHGHRDHIGGAFKFYQKFPDVPWMSHSFTLDVAEDDLRDHGIRTMPRRIEEEVYEIGEFKVKLFGVNHSIPGACGVVVEVGGETIVFTGDCKEWKGRVAQGDEEKTDKNEKVFGKLAGGKRVSLLVLDSTNAEQSGQRAISENQIARNFGTILNVETGRVFVTMFSSHVQRMQMFIEEAKRHRREVYVAGKEMRDMLHRMKVSGWHDLLVKGVGENKYKLYLSSDDEAEPLDPNTLPDNAVILCSGGLGEPDSFLRRMADGLFDFPYKKGDVLVIAQSVIRRDTVRDRFVLTMTKLVGRNGTYSKPRRIDRVYVPGQDQAPYIPIPVSGGAEIIRCPKYNAEGNMLVGSIHFSGHGNLEFKMLVWELLGKPPVLPWHGHREIRQTLANAISAAGGKTVLLEDGENCIIEASSPPTTVGGF